MKQNKISADMKDIKPFQQQATFKYTLDNQLLCTWLIDSTSKNGEAKRTGFCANLQSLNSLSKKTGQIKLQQRNQESALPTAVLPDLS